MATLQQKQPKSFTVRGLRIFRSGKAEPLVFTRLGDKGVVYVAKIKRRRKNKPIKQL